MVTVAVPSVGVSESPSIMGPPPRNVCVDTIEAVVMVAVVKTKTVVVARHCFIVVEFGEPVPVGPVGAMVVPLG